MTSAAFQKAMQRGMVASPFGADLIYRTSAGSITIKCVVEESNNKQEQDD